MARKQPPVGTLAKLTPDWFVSSGAAACGFQPAVAGQFGVVSLFNNDTAALRSIYIYGLTLQTFGATQCDLQLKVGSFGSLVGPGSPLDDSLAPGAVPGQIFIGSNATTTIGLESGHIGIRNGTDWWPYNFPIKKLSPGNAFLLVAADTNVAINVAFWWFADQRLG